MVLDWPGVWFSFLLGMGTFFSPCSVALLPAYVGYYSGLVEGDRPAVAWRSARAGLRFGAAAAAGIFTVFVVAAALVQTLRTQIGLDSRSLGAGLEWLAIAVGVIVIVLGILMMSGRGISWNVRMRAPQQKTIAGMAAFGALYAVASIGCTLPLFLSMLATSLSVGPAEGSLRFLAFGLSMSGLMVGASLALSLGQDAARRRFVTLARWAKPFGGAVMTLAGIYVIYYYVALPPA